MPAVYRHIDTSQAAVAGHTASAGEGEVEQMERRLIEGFSQGYTRAILDLIEHVPAVLDDMKRCGVRIDKKSVTAMLRLFLEHRHDLRDRFGFMRWNNQRKELEWYMGNG